ncbi:MAG TPA: YigZ family protein [Symbiobacteriaceae bacterium]
MAYLTVRGHGQAEIVIKKSRFIANVAPAPTEEAAWAFIEKIRAEHREATHNCFAFKAGTAQRMSDDGEPSGTAGRPIFDVLEKQGLSDTVIVVTRYFGGILLGAGGLVRAYSQAAAAGVKAAGIAEGVPAVDLRLHVAYALVGKVQHLLQQRGALILDTGFGVDATIDCRVLKDAAAGLERELTDLSAGRLRIDRLREVLVTADLRPIHTG